MGIMDTAAQVVQDNRGTSIMQMLRAANKVVNQKMVYKADVRNGGEFWSGPGETLGSGTGDCEDAAILKIRVLMAMDVPMRDLNMFVIFFNFTSGSERGGHAIAGYRRQQILDWRNEPIPYQSYWDGYVERRYMAKDVVLHSVISARRLFPGGLYDNDIRSLSDISKYRSRWQRRRN